MRMYKGAIFDLDGTLLNTLDDLTASVQWAMTDMGLKPCSREQVRDYIGSGALVLCRRCLGENADESTLKELLSRFQAHYREHLRDNTAPFPGILELLHGMKEKGVKRGVVSNKFSAATQAVCAFYFPDLMDAVVGEEPGVAIKPAPDSLLAVMRRFGLTPDECVMIGDSPQDIIAARRAGCLSVGVTWGYRSRSVLEEAGADRIIDKASDLWIILGMPAPITEAETVLS